MSDTPSSELTKDAKDIASTLHLMANGHLVVDVMDIAEGARVIRQLLKTCAVRQIAWLVERTDLGYPHWWTGRPLDDGGFTTDPSKPLRFARQADAEQAIRLFFPASMAADLVATEHLWIGR